MRVENSTVRIEADSPPVVAAVAVEDDIHLLVTNDGASAGVCIDVLLSEWQLVEPRNGSGCLSVNSPLFYKVVEKSDQEAVRSGCIQMFTVDFDVEPDRPTGTDGLRGDLTDNQRATVVPVVSGISSLRGHSVSMTVRPEQTEGIVNKKGTSVSVDVNASSSSWKTTPIYWYGLNPDGCCYYRRFCYVFDLMVDGVLCSSHKYNVGWPAENPRMEYNIEDLRMSSSTVGDIEGSPGTNGSWRAKIVFAPFAKKTGCLVDCPSSSQYSVEIGLEESFHKRQWEEDVPVEQGGSGDCFTVLGLRWFAQRNTIGVSLAHGDYGLWRIASRRLYECLASYQECGGIGS